jgi:RNA polymerase-binding transcription factor DksA
MEQVFLKLQKKKLQKKAKELSQRIHDKSIREPVRGDAAELAAIAAEQACTGGSVSIDTDTLHDVEDALRAIESGTYGNCVNSDCQVEIIKPRLDATPWARYCVICQRDIDLARKGRYGTSLEQKTKPPISTEEASA